MCSLRNTAKWGLARLWPTSRNPEVQNTEGKMDEAPGSVLQTLKPPPIFSFPVWTGDLWPREGQGLAGKYTWSLHVNFQ